MISGFDSAVADNFGKWCGKWTAKGRAFDGSEIRYHRVHCKSWHCRYCAPRRARAYAKGIEEAAQRHNLSRFVTLTLDPKRVKAEPRCIYAGCEPANCKHEKHDDGGASCKYLRECFNKLRVYLGRKFGRAIKYIAVMEFHESGLAHLHMIVDRYIEWAWLKNAWQAVGGGSHVDIRARKDQHRIAKYLAKYLTKDLLSDCPRKQRRVTCSRGITLLQKLGKKHNWLLIRDSIRWVFGRRCAVASNVEFDQFDMVKAFVVKTESGKNLKRNSPSYGWWGEAICEASTK